MKYCLLTICFILFLASCERKADFDLDTVEPKLVVEATIENGERPLVYLTKSQAYFSQVDISLLSNSFVHNAEVYVSNGLSTHRLKEYTVPAGPGLFFYYYSTDSANLATAFLGELNKTYSLRVISEGKEYAASTRIPSITKIIDSLYWKSAPPNVDSSKVILVTTLTDPPGLGDYSRYFTRRNKEVFYAGINSVFDDQVIDGTTYTVQVDRGVPRDIAGGDLRFFVRGDTVSLKLSNIDKATYDFWRTMEFSYASVGNPFSTPTRVLSNINGGALGYFGGYASQVRTIIVPE